VTDPVSSQGVVWSIQEKRPVGHHLNLGLAVEAFATSLMRISAEYQLTGTRFPEIWIEIFEFFETSPGISRRWIMNAIRI